MSYRCHGTRTVTPGTDGGHGPLSEPTLRIPPPPPPPPPCVHHGAPLSVADFINAASSASGGGLHKRQSSLKDSDSEAGAGGKRRVTFGGEVPQSGLAPGELPQHFIAKVCCRSPYPVPYLMESPYPLPVSIAVSLP